MEALACNFSTTDKIHQVMSTAIIMSSFKKFFNYARVLGFCGINRVCFAGERADWEKLLNKLCDLRKYDVDGVLEKYVTHVREIIEKFIESFDGKPDVAWWNRIMAT